MKPEELFAQVLFIDNPWFVEKIDLNIQNGELNIFIDFERGSEFAYEDHELGIKGKCLRFLTAHVPRVDIRNGKVRRVRTPWEGESIGFTLMFEAFALELLKMLPVHQAYRLLGFYDNKLWNVMHTYTEKAREVADYSNVKRLGVDETAARRGHDYVSLFVDLDEKKTIFVTEGRGSETVKAFARDLQQHQGKPEEIKEVACDVVLPKNTASG